MSTAHFEESAGGDDGPAGGELEKALQNLPHGPEFRFIDRLIALEPRHSGAAEFTLRGDEPFLAGHFPGDPLMPGVLIIEACAQLVGIVAQAGRAATQAPRLQLAKVREARFRQPVRPRETLRLETEVARTFGRMVQAKVRAMAGEAVVMEGEVILAEIEVEGGAPAGDQAKSAS